MIAMFNLDETFRKCLWDISWCIPIIIQSTSHLIKLKHKETFYCEILEFLSDFKQLTLTDSVGTFRECCRDTSGQIVCLCRYFESCTIFKHKKIFYWVIKIIFKNLCSYQWLIGLKLSEIVFGILLVLLLGYEYHSRPTQCWNTR